MATLTKKETILDWNGYKVGDKVELAFLGRWLQNSVKFPILNKYYWIEGKVAEVYKKGCVVNCLMGIGNVLVIDIKGIRHYDTNKERLA